ncbi:MAG: hypothetical protein ACREFL_13755 [Stellaceae bacterium]
MRFGSGFPALALVGLVCTAAASNAGTLQRAAAAPSPNPLLLRVDAQYGDAQDDTDFLFRLGMMEGHLMIGHELLVQKHAALALPHFGHPVRELYADIEDYLAKRRFPAFDGQLAALEAAVAASPGSPKTEAKYQAAIATIHKARALAPASLRASLPEMIQICSDTIDAASGEYGEGIEKGQIASIVEYHDSKGYLEYVQQALDELRSTHPEAAAQSLLDKFQAVLAKAEWIVEPLLPDPAPRASVGTYRAIAGEAAALARP